MAPRIPKSVTEDITPIEGPDGDSKREFLEFDGDFKRQIVWKNVMIMSYFHIGALYGLYLAFDRAHWLTLAFSAMLYFMGGLGITAGVHRLWSHRSYKARFPLRFMLMLFNCIAVQNHIYEWARDHRVHHKFSETDADPHNAKRGFFFSHCGWLLSKKHPNVGIRGKTVDCSDILADPVVRFQMRYYSQLILIFNFILPAVIPNLLWGEPLYTAFCVASLLRYVCLLHATWCVNSLAHLIGNRPYDKKINPAENLLVTIAAVGEGFHNYHHTFPWDYAASEFGVKLNPTTIFINLMAKIGWAYDLKVVSRDMIMKRRMRTGDLSEHHDDHDHHHHDEEPHPDDVKDKSL